MKVLPRRHPHANKLSQGDQLHDERPFIGAGQETSAEEYQAAPSPSRFLGIEQFRIINRPRR
jgi:hypothetical protein